MGRKRQEALDDWVDIATYCSVLFIVTMLVAGPAFILWIGSLYEWQVPGCER